MSADVITEKELVRKGVKYIKNEQASVFYVEKSDFDKLADYTYRTIGTPITVVVDAAIVVLVAYVVISSGGFLPIETHARAENRFTDKIDDVDKVASTPQGEKALAKQLTKVFSVTTEQIKMLREQNVKYGEVAMILALAQTMTGGVTDYNINVIHDLRKANTEWVDISKIIAADSKLILKKVKMIGEEAEEDMKKDTVSS